MQDACWRAEERAGQLSAELEAASTARQKVEMEARVQVTRVEADARTAHSQAESSKNELATAREYVSACAG